MMTSEERKAEIQKIIAIKPALFDLSEQSSISQYGFQCDSGWFPAIRELIQELAEINLSKEFHISQVKEKWSELKIHYYPLEFEAKEQVAAIIEKYRLRLETVCESCGGYAQLKTDGGFYRVRCDACEAAELAERQEK
jgi:hypothetical protein